MSTEFDRRRFFGYLLSSAAAGSLALSACAGEGGGTTTKAPEKKPEPAKAPEPEAKPEPAAEPEAAAAPSGDVQKIKLEVGDGIKYDVTEIKVKSGSTVEVTIEHTGKLPKEAMGHNFVLLKQGTDMAKFANAAMLATATQYVPEDMKDSVIAHTKVVGGGESDTITFTAPAPGEYGYLCSFPGHYANMNGKMIVS
ncbi:MAG: azurin [Myxococcota bacterium]